jgi:transcriptional regulator with XRE-family HTH domain
VEPTVRPISRLGEARRARGWTQGQVLLRLRRQADVEGFRLPGEASLRTQLSRWENGRRVGKEMYRSLFREIFRATDAELLRSRSPFVVSQEIEDGLVVARLYGGES